MTFWYVAPTMATGTRFGETVKRAYDAARLGFPLSRKVDYAARRKYLMDSTRLGSREIKSTTDTISDVRKSLTKIMGIKSCYSPLQHSREHLMQLLPSTQEELPTRSMQDSFASAVIPLSTDFALREKYVTFLGHVRLGRLMEDMDIFAVWVANKHLSNPRMKEGDALPYVLVTVLVDQIDFTDYIPKATGDIRLSGHVSWAGRSSIEVAVWLEQEDQNEWQKLTRALFVMAARDSLNKGPAFVNSLIPANDEEKEILEGGIARKLRRQRFQNVSPLMVVPTLEEQQIIHDMFIKTTDANHYLSSRRTLPPGATWMEDARVSNLVFSHPEDRNYHNKVFGGFLMRHALELSWASAYLFAKKRPKLLHINDIRFHRPVDVGSLIRMHSNIIYTEHECIQIAVHAEVYAPESDEITTTNEFHYTYKINIADKVVFPRTYHEAMVYLNGRRNFQRIMGLKQ